MDDGLKIIIIVLISGILAFFIGSYFIVTFLGITPLKFDLGASLIFGFCSIIFGLIPIYIVLQIVSYFQKIIESISQKNIE